MKEPSAEKINKHIDRFTDIYIVDGREANPIPDDTKVTVWCDDGDEEQGFAWNTDTLDLGLNAFIAKKWILQSELEKLLNQ